ncbi:tail assembly chaperone [Virgibacillus pantothenticus]|uniref:tail assembly chaperone n=1 Tax=Virgibacillus pantothenticus TaxID=1473 RepID=UPI001C2119FE|nr:tail assembly chaperone [Virgibacillus pantothenticus]MBU8568202.1 tail assembly chaperone [Virgibacillus pantothenticus]MBU8601872.1 tail assembly chaperone [Virgibacillus pantothenticus]MBU8636035.1 tail assembly chaperone [Virgibacillus pantothenticus]MBU8644114.1 tail assembly chaperone [Virgibacillus pantothenticus]MBU8647934.1 tail assembly chaperone [Virgibacillus pantothenticus]
MEFIINEKVYELKFGIKFIRELDKVYEVDYQGMKFGMGVNMAFMNLQQWNPVAIHAVIKAAVSYLDTTPSSKQIEKAVEQYALENDGLGDLFTELKDELGKSPVMKDTIKQMQGAAKQKEG